jgi:uncharacterized protein
MRYALILGGCLLAGAAAAEGPSFDCAKAGSEAEKAVCAESALAKLDRRLAERYRAALAAAEGLDAGSAEATQALKATQRGWIKGRDECWKAENLKACVRDAYQIREAELVSKWMLQEPMATRFYACEGNPANEVAVMFFDTELPAIRLEYGDGIRSGWLVPAGSGSKYATPFGGMFWEKGDEALFVWTEGQEMTCTATG